MDGEHPRIRPIQWQGDRLLLLDQRRLPQECRYITCDDAETVAAAIRDMAVRGAPAIGIAAAYGVVLGARAGARDAAAARLLEARPTAVNLHWAVRRMQAVADGADLGDRLEHVARQIHAAELAGNTRMGGSGAALIDGPAAVLTHCNTGTLATGGLGTALAVVRRGRREGRVRQVYYTETRPWLQGARLTGWELAEDGIDATLIADGAAAALMAAGRVDWVIVGADRVAANGDIVNKIGTYGLALAARAHGVRFMVVAPLSTVDPATPEGAAVTIEERSATELLTCGGARVAPATTTTWNPVFDVTPAQLVDALVTDQGVLRHPDRAGVEALLTGELGIA